MKLYELKLENFQGIRDMRIAFDGQSVDIIGDNATGKTTVYNALTWLLFDKASTGAKNFTPKTRGEDGEIHGLDHTVEGAFSDGHNSIVLKKDFHEIWKRKRNSNVDEFSGHEVTYFVDGTPTTEREYQAAITAMMGDAETLKILTMPEYFSEVMPWQDRRAALLKMCGDISDEFIIMSTPELSELPDYLKQGTGLFAKTRTVEDFKKVAADQKSQINKMLDGIPARIDEAKRAKPDVKKSIAEINAEIESLKAQKAQIGANNPKPAEIAAIEKTIHGLVTARMNAQTVYINKTAAQNAERYERNAAVNKEMCALEMQIAAANHRIESQDNARRQWQYNLNAMNDEIAAAESLKFDAESEICPTCKRRLTDEMIESARKAFSDSVTAKITGIKKRYESTNMAALKAINETQAAEVTKRDELQARYDELEKKLVTVCNVAMPFEETPECVAYDTRIREQETKLNVLKVEYEDIRETEEDIRGQIDAGIKLAESAKRDAEYAESLDDRINELLKEEKELSAKYESVEKGLYLCELFTRKKVAMLDGQINGHFENVRFRLFKEQINGGIADDCEVMIPTDQGVLVPYAFANHAARLNAGLEIIRAYTAHTGLEMPVVIDNAESVTHLVTGQAQIIRLVVSEQDKALRLELK